MGKDSQFSITQDVIVWTIWPGNSPFPTDFFGPIAVYP